jgi:pyruvate,water dikinase
MAKESRMIVKCTEDFQVIWENPEDANLNWHWDKLHNPRPLPPLSGDIMARECARAFRSRVTLLNGYPYTQGDEFPQPTPEVLQRGALAVWEEDYVPRIREACSRWRTTDYSRMSAADLVHTLDNIIDEAGEMFLLTMVVVMAFGFPTNVFADFCDEALGSDGDQVAAAVLQGYENASASAGSRLGDLAARAASSPQLAKAMTEGRYDDLAHTAGGAEFLDAFEQYLDEYGWRAENWSHFHIPTWAEDPRIPLMLIGRYIEDASASPAGAVARAIQQREAAEAEAQARLSAEKLGRFEELAEKAHSHVRISESRAFWQLTIDGAVRVPILALAEKLVHLGGIESPDDIFFLHWAEVEEEASAPSGKYRDAVRQRRADLHGWESLTPPDSVGAPRKPAPDAIKKAVDRFDGGEVAPSSDPDLITGNGASKGVARGTARVITTLGESDRLQKGDVLVCPSTAPPWTPLFAIASAVVTDTGGILSHSAICAREYGIPCVAGTRVATARIEDGAVVTVDGGAGTVRIER